MQGKGDPRHRPRAYVENFSTFDYYKLTKWRTKIILLFPGWNRLLWRHSHTGRTVITMRKWAGAQSITIYMTFSGSVKAIHVTQLPLRAYESHTVDFSNMNFKQSSARRTQPTRITHAVPTPQCLTERSGGMIAHSRLVLIEYLHLCAAFKEHSKINNHCITETIE